MPGSGRAFAWAHHAAFPAFCLTVGLPKATMAPEAHMRSCIFCLILVAAGLTTTPLNAQTDPFVGHWKLTKLTDQMSVAKVGVHTYVFNFEGGGPEKIAVDGTYQRGIGGTMLSVTPEGPNWKVERKRDGQKLLAATWTLSKDSNSLTDTFTSFDKNGVPSDVKLVYTRTAAGSGFAGTWTSESAAIGSPTILVIRPYKSNGLSLIVPSEELTVNLNFDGKNVRRVDARTFEIKRKADGKITQTEEYLVSSDLKTLTRVVHVVGESQPLITVFERQ